MLTFDFDRNAHTIFPELYFCTQYVNFLHTDIKPTSIWPKIEVHDESNFHFGPPIDFSTTSTQ